VKLKNGDILITSCFQNESTKARPEVDGVQVCMATLLYYPAVPHLLFCVSIPISNITALRMAHSNLNRTMAENATVAENNTSTSRRSKSSGLVMAAADAGMEESQQDQMMMPEDENAFSQLEGTTDDKEKQSSKDNTTLSSEEKDKEISDEKTSKAKEWNPENFPQVAFCMPENASMPATTMKNATQLLQLIQPHIIQSPPKFKRMSSQEADEECPEEKKESESSSETSGVEEEEMAEDSEEGEEQEQDAGTNSDSPQCIRPAYPEDSVLSGKGVRGKAENVSGSGFTLDSANWTNSIDIGDGKMKLLWRCEATKLKRVRHNTTSGKSCAMLKKPALCCRLRWRPTPRAGWLWASRRLARPTRTSRTLTWRLGGSRTARSSSRMPTPSPRLSPSSTSSRTSSTSRECRRPANNSRFSPWACLV